MNSSVRQQLNVPISTTRKPSPFAFPWQKMRSLSPPPPRNNPPPPPHLTSVLSSPFNSNLQPWTQQPNVSSNLETQSPYIIISSWMQIASCLLSHSPSDCLISSYSNNERPSINPTRRSGNSNLAIKATGPPTPHWVTDRPGPFPLVPLTKY